MELYEEVDNKKKSKLPMIINSYYSYNRNYNIFKTISYANNCKWSKQK